MQPSIIEPQSTELSKQKERLEAIQNLGYNVVNCGHCGDIIIISTTNKSDWIECQGCGFTGEHCDYPDYVY
tara:strand:+ start:277 stop:489 length:213 start_codon:yes stop_codon:yes gene_type:complete